MSGLAEGCDAVTSLAAMKALDIINGKYSPDFIQFLYLMMT
jgi:hypothetical protein